MNTFETLREDAFTEGLRGVFPSYEERRQSLLEKDKIVIKRVWYQKEGIMRARFVRFEQIRVLNLLYRRLCAFATESCVRGVYCKMRDEHAEDHDHDAIHNDINVITTLYRKQPQEIFSDSIASTITDEEVYDYLKRALIEQLKAAELNSVTESIIESEIEYAVEILRNNNTHPVLSHRAEGFGDTEASKEAIYSVVQERVAELEFDVRMCHDKVPVLHHDVSLIGTNGTDARVPDMTSEEFLSLELGTEEHLASLEDVFKILVEENNAVTRIHIDLKDFEPEFMDNVIDLVHTYDFEHRVVIVSWLPQALQYAYERDYTLAYSFSYFPEVRGISRFILRTIYKTRNHNVPLFGKIATFISSVRASHKGRGTEIITDTVLLDAEVHWSKLGETKEACAVVGKHHMGISRLGTVLNRNTIMMARVIQGGFINVLAFEEIFDALCLKIGFVKICRSTIAFLDRSRKPALARLARKFKTIGIRVSVYDLDKEASMEEHFGNFEARKVQAGPVFTNNQLLVPRLR